MRKVEYYILLKKGKADLGQRVKICSGEDEAKRECYGRQAERTQEQRDLGWEYSIFVLRPESKARHGGHNRIRWPR